MIFPGARREVQKLEALVLVEGVRAPSLERISETFVICAAFGVVTSNPTSRNRRRRGADVIVGRGPLEHGRAARRGDLRVLLDRSRDREADPPLPSGRGRRAGAARSSDTRDRSAVGRPSSTSRCRDSRSLLVGYPGLRQLGPIPCWTCRRWPGRSRPRAASGCGTRAPSAMDAVSRHDGVGAFRSITAVRAGRVEEQRAR